MSPQKPAQVPAAEPMARISYAQNMEDILLDRVFKGRPGTFMDIGANHPFLESNTYFFYLRGWRGVNFEPIPSHHALFLQHRPEDLNLNVAASDADGELTFHEIANAGGLTGHSSLSGEVAEEHRAQGFDVRSYPVRSRTVASLVAEYRIEPPDFLSLDVECHEAAVIRGIPWATWRPKALVIESLEPISHAASFNSWEATLAEHGYLFAATNGINRFYLRDDLRDRLPRLQTPVNCLDHYTRADEALKQAEVEELHCRVQYLQREYDRLAADREWDRANFERIQAGWHWGRAQAELAKDGFAREMAAFDHHRENFERSVEQFQREKQLWEAERVQTQEDRAWERGEWARERDGWAGERDGWAGERAEFERRWAAWEWERAGLTEELAAARAEAEGLRGQLSTTERALRPYHLLDRLGVVAAGYGMARKVKRRFVR